MSAYHGPSPPVSSHLTLPDVPSTTILCTWGQDIVQDIVKRNTEIFSLLKSIVPPSGNTVQTQILQEKKARIAEHMRVIELMFKKLKVVYDEIAKQSSQYAYIKVDSLIPYEEGSESGTGRSMLDENKEQNEYLLILKNQLAAELKEKNQQLKMIINQLRNLSFDINTMLAMRKR